MVWLWRYRLKLLLAPLEAPPLTGWKLRLELVQARERVLVLELAQEPGLARVLVQPRARVLVREPEPVQQRVQVPALVQVREQAVSCRLRLPHRRGRAPLLSKLCAVQQ